MGPSYQDAGGRVSHRVGGGIPGWSVRSSATSPALLQLPAGVILEAAGDGPRGWVSATHVDSWFWSGLAPALAVVGIGGVDQWLEELT